MLKTHTTAIVLAPDVDLSEFIRSETHGIRAVVAYMNQMSDRGPGVFDAFRMLQYEDLVSSPEDTFIQVLDLFGTDIDRAAVRSAVARASFENLQGL